MSRRLLPTQAPALDAIAAVSVATRGTAAALAGALLAAATEGRAPPRAPARATPPPSTWSLT